MPLLALLLLCLALVPCNAHAEAAERPGSKVWTWLGYPGPGRLKTGWSLSAHSLYTLRYYSQNGWGGGLGWMAPDPSWPALGAQVSLSYQEHPLATATGRVGGVDYQEGEWGRSFDGKALLTWSPWHGRGLKNTGFARFGAGWIWGDRHLNSYKIDDLNGPSRSQRWDSGNTHLSSPVASVGGGVSIKGGLELYIGGVLDSSSYFSSYLGSFFIPREGLVSLGYQF